MAAEFSDRVREIAEARGVPESEVFEQALERGIADLWENVILGKYVGGEHLAKRRSNSLSLKVFSEPTVKRQSLKRTSTGISTRDD